jgi:F-type H+-transporting ATPase subunit c
LRETKTNNEQTNMLAEITGITGNELRIGLAFAGAAIGIGIAAFGGVMAIGRNPGAFGKIFTTMLIGMALAEGLAILAWIVAK